MTDPPFARGSCRCGEVTLTITEKPKMMLQCHCLDCQKATGTGHTSNVYFDEKDVLIQGEATGHSVTADSGNEMTRYFCPLCGSRMYGRNSGRPGLISVQVGCLDDHSWFSAQAVLFTSRRHDWDITADDIPNFDKMPPSKS
ncbi:MAG: GFA family protein [Arenicellales bacterium]|nr:GFA family protein [Arenicellales bacterium]